MTGQRLSLAALALLSAALAYGAARYGATAAPDWRVSMALIGAAALLIPLLERAPGGPPALGAWLKWPMILFVAYALFQITPLPVFSLNLFSPRKAELLAALADVGQRHGFAPMSVVPPLTFDYFLRTVTYACVFLVAREAVWWNSARPWVAAAPMMAIGFVEAGYGLIRYAAGLGKVAHGSYVNRNHFAGLLEMVLPFFILYAAWLVRKARRSGRWPVKLALALYALGAGACVVFAAILYSLSRMGFAASLAAMIAVAYLQFRRQMPLILRIALLAGCAVAFVAGLILLAPAEMADRMANVAENGDAAPALRLATWLDTLHLIRDYPLFGCGLGGFANTFLRYQTVSPAWSYPHAHNDYLQMVAEMGILGSMLPAALMAGIVMKTIGATSKRYEAHVRFLALACAGSLTAILIHSFTDFNTHIPANAVAMSWVAGIGVALSDFPRRGARPNRFG